MNQPEAGVMFVYALTEPIDDFDALTPLPDWIIADPVQRTRWTLQAVLALADTATPLRWTATCTTCPLSALSSHHPVPSHTSWSSRTTAARPS